MISKSGDNIEKKHIIGRINNLKLALKNDIIIKLLDRIIQNETIFIFNKPQN